MQGGEHPVPPGGPEAEGSAVPGTVRLPGAEGVAQLTGPTISVYTNDEQ